MAMIQEVVSGLSFATKQSEGRDHDWLQTQKLISINNILQALCFDYHPSSVNERALKLN